MDAFLNVIHILIRICPFYCLSVHFTFYLSISLAVYLFYKIICPFIVLACVLYIYGVSYRSLSHECYGQCWHGIKH